MRRAGTVGCMVAAAAQASARNLVATAIKEELWNAEFRNIPVPVAGLQVAISNQITQGAANLAAG